MRSLEVAARPPGDGDPLRPRSGVERWFTARTVGLHPSLTPVAVGLAGALVLAVVLGTVGLALVAAEPVAAVDDRVTDAVRRARTTTWTSAASAVTRATEAWTVLGVVLGAGSVLALTNRWRPLTVLLVSVQVELAVLLVVSVIVDRPRPDAIVGAEPFTASFPSGHTATAIALYGALAVVAASLAPHTRIARPAAAATATVAVVVGGSRVVLGLHHLSDVVAGFALGGASLVVGVVAARALPLAPATADEGRRDPVQAT